MQKVLKSKYVLLAAFKFTTQQEAHSQIIRPQFHRLMASIYLFSHLWDLICTVDKSHDDKRITKDEFLKAKELCSAMTFLHISKVSEEEWNKEFNRLDEDHNGTISFYELCSYIVKNVVNMDIYLTDKVVEEKQPEEDEDNDLDGHEGGRFHYMSASAAVAAWEAAEALKLAQLEEQKALELESAGLIEHNSIRNSMIHSAVIKAEIAAQNAALAMTKDEAWTAADTADFQTSVAAIVVENAVIDRQVMEGRSKPSSFSNQNNNDIIHNAIVAAARSELEKQ
eukprot:CAMPEP_0170078990 /NCGR_PEP_ID=MMETSP0019_2-20121128/15484_1 /TAXON_ID=98059 /ORGANISM="Dinobryon sp., Strain UTEXLB2267" /LENGTH=281 /DNA_ID=CAMNT_0010292225 /DNA_START=281 /DNA_END=1126 /DNA_ORIENTATION=-